MYTKDGESYFIVDAHIALWDARPENIKNVHGQQFIDWLVSAEGQKAIADYKINGQQLFFPNATVPGA